MDTLNLRPKRADVGVYDGHEYGATGLTTFIVTRSEGGIGGYLEGSVFDGELIELHDGDAELGIFCVGWHTNGPRTLWIEVPAEDCEEYDEDRDDPMASFWKDKYAEDAAKDKPGEVPFLFLMHAIRDLEAENETSKNFPPNKNADDRRRRWLAALHAYRYKHYKDVE